jgi:hypothetical protein
MKDIQDNDLKVKDIVYTCVNGRSKRLREGVVMALGDTGKTAEIVSFEDNTRYSQWGIRKNNKTAATIVKAVNQDKKRIPEWIRQELGIIV